MHCRSSARLKPLADLLDHLSDQLASSGARGVGQQSVEFDQQGDEVQVGFDGTEHLRFEQQLAQLQPLDRVALHHLHHGGREVATDVAQPTRHCGSGLAEATAAPSTTLATGLRVVHRGQRSVDARIVTVEPQGSDPGSASVVVGIGVAAEHHPPAPEPFQVADPTER